MSDNFVRHFTRALSLLCEFSFFFVREVTPFAEFEVAEREVSKGQSLEIDDAVAARAKRRLISWYLPSVSVMLPCVASMRSRRQGFVV